MAETSARLTFHRSLYLPDAVRAAAEAYGPYATTIEVTDTEVETIAVLTGFDPEYGEALPDGFANHALFETVVRTRAALGGPA
jgi:hypothetical protein